MCFFPFSVQDGLAADFRSLTKTLYDLHKVLGADAIHGSPLKELVIESFDEEQIWQQLELQNDAVLDYFKNEVARNVKDKDLFLIPVQEEDGSDAEMSSEKEMEPEDGMEADQILDDAEDESEVTEKQTKSRTLKRQQYSDEDSDIDFDIDELEEETKKSKMTTSKKMGEKSIVDDKFFKLWEMEAFLDDLEKTERREMEEDDDDEINYFEDMYSEEEDEEESKKDKIKPVKSSRDLKYKDFFDSVDGGNDDDNPARDDGDDQNEEDETEDDISETEEANEMEVTEQNGKNKEASRKVTFNLPDDNETEEDTDMLNAKRDDSIAIKSSFEKRQEKMSEKIKSLEEELLKEKPWQLKGEITGQKRPENSLLEETVFFDHAVRMAPVITEETTLQLEDIIKQRIKDQAWDDVVRKEKPKEEAFEYKKRLTLDHEKSKLSLAEIYEQEYLKFNQQKVEEEEDPEHIEIQKMMDSLFVQLDALSNFHFTPKPPAPEIKIVSNLPAISMEEVAPVAVSDAALLAPEEIKEKNKAGDVKTDSEKTSTDKKRERRKKKLRKRMKLKEKEKRQKILEKTKPEQNKLNKKAAATKLKKLTKEGKASLLKDEGKDKALKSSQAFFSQLQDQVKVQIKDAKKIQKKQKQQQEISAHKLKL
ncbi:PREDICTED: U3 small nucleolar ribonucleoprotein protein MPP10 [Gavialis gangeticus]|uniref:U3 small nucleolar ribonucleoprotein protein MPP10 n=1 Tax=Gavialis gangeticus TaxID=94835 RepID=UPI00092E6B48|nr:PREDICTED: U3 small nucleolar ribonucleoprotein protein MPP10 [Gavialis gangeticus]